MILKTMKKAIYEPENTTEKVETYEVDYIDNISSAKKVYNYNHSFTSLDLKLNNGDSLCLLLSENQEGTEKMLYEHVFLLNNSGQTIERII